MEDMYNKPNALQKIHLQSYLENPYFLFLCVTNPVDWNLQQVPVYLEIY